MDAFYGMITNIDENVGRLRGKLTELGLDENTVLIYMSDNGTAAGVSRVEDAAWKGFNAGMRGIKGSEYEGGHRTPFFVHWPAGGLEGGRDVDRLTANVDIMPTLMDLCGLDWRAREFDGTSLAPLLQDEGVAWADRVLVTDSQRITAPEKWRKSAAMSQRWRLVNGVELYDMENDPSQEKDVAAEHPEVVDRLRRAYEAWWEKVSRQFDGTVPLVLGAAEAPATMLNAHDWRNPEAECAWNQTQVRAGLACNGYWEVEVARPGTYRIELRRWPKEEDRPIREGIEGALVGYNAIGDGYGGGRALAVEEAVLEVAGQTFSSPVGEADKGVVFRAALDAGETVLLSRFTTAGGEEVGAYYVYVEREDDLA